MVTFREIAPELKNRARTTLAPGVRKKAADSQGPASAEPDDFWTELTARRRIDIDDVTAARSAAELVKYFTI